MLLAHYFLDIGTDLLQLLCQWQQEGLKPNLLPRSGDSGEEREMEINWT